jgi:hypothetical protein
MDGLDFGIFSIIGMAVILSANAFTSLFGLHSWLRPMKPAKLEKLYISRKVEKIFTPEEWAIAANYVNRKNGALYFITSGVGTIWVAGNLIAALVTGSRTFIDLAIYGNVAIILPPIFLSARISKKQYGINILGQDYITDTEAQAFHAHMEAGV